MKAWIGIGVLVVGLLGLVGWRWRSEATAAGELKSQQGARRGSTPAVEIASVTSRSILTTIDTVGTLESPLKVRISPRTAGRVTFLDVREGDRVEAGQVLARIDPQEVDAQVLQQRASVAESRARLAEAQARTSANQTEIESQIRQQQALVTKARADLKKAERNFDAQVAAAAADVDDASARLSAAEAQQLNALAEIRAAQADLTNTQARLKRTRELFEKGYVAEQEVENLETLVESRRATVEVKQGLKVAADSAILAAKAQKVSAQKRVTITKQSSETDIELAKASLLQAQASLAQAVANRAQNPAYQQNLKALQAGVDSADAELGQASARRSDTELRASIRGTVTERTGDPGSIATPGQALLTVESLDWLYVSATIPVDRASEVSIGKRAMVAIDGFPGKSFDGFIDKVNRAADPQSRQFEVKIRLENKAELLRPGMFAKVKVIVSQSAPATVVPLEAVRKDGPQSSVMVVGAEDVVEQRTVEVGDSDAGGVAILSGLRPGERILVLSYQPVKEGQKVRIAAERQADGTSKPVKAEPKGGKS